MDRTVNRRFNRFPIAAALLIAFAFSAAPREAKAVGIPFVDLPRPYESSGPIVSWPATLIGGGVGAVVGAVFIPPMIVLSILPMIGIVDAIVGPLKIGWGVGVQTVGWVAGAPLWLVKKVVWDLPVAVLTD